MPSTVAAAVGTASAATGDTIGEFDPTSTSTLPPPAGPVHGALAAWDMCVANGPMQILDPDTGTVLTTVALAGRPAWSPDGRRLASLDNSDGAVRVADIVTGRVRTLAELHVPPFAGDDCGTSGRVDWSPDGTTLLVSYTTFAGTAPAHSVVRIVRVDAPGEAILFDDEHSALGTTASARWLTDGDVMIVEASTSGSITVQRAPPWGSWPPAPQTLTFLTQSNIGRPAISPDGTHLAVPVYGPPPPPPTSFDPADQPLPSGAVVVVDVASGHTDTIARYVASEITFSPDATEIALVGADYQLVVVPIGSTAPSFTGPFGAFGVSWSPDRRSVATVDGAPVQRLDLASGVVHDLTDSRSGGVWVTEWEPV